MNIYRIPVSLATMPSYTPTHYDQRFNKREWIKHPSRYFPHQNAREKGRRLSQKEKFNA